MINEIALPTVAYSVSKLQHLQMNGQLKDSLDCINYVYQYYFEVSCGLYYFYDYLKDEFIVKTDKDFRKEVVDKLGDNKITNMLKKNCRIFNVVAEINKPRVYSIDDNYFHNVSGQFKHASTYKRNYDEYPEEIKKKVERILTMIRELTCNDDKRLFELYLVYLAKIARGQKTEIVMYRKTATQGVGKSTETNFLVYNVFGTKVAMVCTTTDPLLTSYNKLIMGKVLIVFEELPACSTSEWAKIGCKVKSIATEKELVYSDKYEKSIIAPNLSNIMINTNVEALQDVEGRRNYQVPFSTMRKEDHEYFNSLNNQCLNDEVGEAFYSYLMTKIPVETVNKFYAQRDLPENQAKKNAIATSLPSAYKFVKEQYMLKKRSISKTKRSQFYELYLSFTTLKDIKYKSGKVDFFGKMKEIGIEAKKITGEFYFEVSIEQLEDIATKFKWICEYDDYEKPQEIKSDVKEVIDYKYKFEKAEKTISKLQDEINKLKEMMNIEKPVEIISQRKLLKQEIQKENERYINKAKQEEDIYEEIMTTTTEEEEDEEYEEEEVVKVVEVKKEKKHIIKPKKDIESESLFETFMANEPKKPRNIEAEKARDRIHEAEEEEKKEKKAKKLTIKSKRTEITEDEEDEDIGDLLNTIKDVVKTKKSLSK